jgi:hypothetical protein
METYLIFGSTDADEFTLQQQNAKTKAATKYAVKVISDFMLEKNYDGEMGTTMTSSTVNRSAVHIKGSNCY